MLEEIIDFAKKGLRIGVWPNINGNKHEWVACVRVGNDPRLTWIQGQPGHGMSAFNSPEDAYKAIIEFCKT